MKKLALALLIGLCVLGLPLQAQIFEGGFAGALSGAMLGSLVGGRSGAAWGAAIGGGVGIIEGANERDRQNHAQESLRQTATTGTGRLGARRPTAERTRESIACCEAGMLPANLGTSGLLFRQY